MNGPSRDRDRSDERQAPEGFPPERKPPGRRDPFLMVIVFVLIALLAGIGLYAWATLDERTAASPSQESTVTSE